MSYAKRPHSPSSSGSPPAKRRAQSPEEGEVENEKTSKHPFPFNNSTNRDYPKSPRRHRLPPRPPSPRNYDRWKNGKRDDESLRPLDTPGAPRAVERVGIEEREEGEETPTSSPRGRDRSRERGRQSSPGRSSSRNRNESRGRDRWRRKPDTIDPKLNSAVEDTIARIEREADAAEAARKKEERPKALRLTPDQEMQSYGRKFVGTSQLRDFAIMEKLGEGTFGEVHKATHTVTRKVVALKRILMHNEKEGLPVTALREIKILKKLRHPSVVTVCDMVVEASTRDRKGSIYMVFPYMDHDLAGLLENPSVKFSPSQIKLYMRQLLEGTEYLHQNKILHRDLKAANLLINNQGSLQIADFGLARPYSTTNPGWDPRQTEGPWDPLKGGPERGGGGARYTNCVVTRWYRPPELLMGDARYGCAIDMWGVGCIMGEMWTRRPILAGSSDADQLERIWELCGTPEDATWPGWRELPGMEGVKVDPGRKVVGRVRQFFSTSTAMDKHGVDLVCKLLTLNPATRATAFEALDHDYFWTEPLPCDPASLPKYVSSHEYDKRKHKAEPAFPPQGGFNMPGPGPGPNFRPSGQWVGPNHGPNHGNHGNHGPNHGPNHGNHGSGYGPGPGWDRGRGRGRGMGRGRGGYNHHSGHNHNGPNHGGNYNGPNHGPPHNHGPPGPPGPNGPPVNFSGYARPPDDRGGGLPPPLGTHSRQHREMRERNMRGRGPAHQPLPSKPEGDVLPYG